MLTLPGNVTVYDRNSRRYRGELPDSVGGEIKKAEEAAVAGKKGGVTPLSDIINKANAKLEKEKPIKKGVAKTETRTPAPTASAIQKPVTSKEGDLPLKEESVN